MTKPATAGADLVAYLRDFYSAGQLELYYCTLTDGSPIPGMGEAERASRAQAIRQILGKPDPAAPVEPIKSKKKK